MSHPLPRLSRRPLHRAAWYAPILAVLLLLAGCAEAGLLDGDVDGPVIERPSATATPQPLPAVDLLRKTGVVMSTVPSYRFEMDMLMRASHAAPGPATTGLPLSVPLFMEGEYVHPDRLRLSSGVKGSPRERFEAVIVGGSYYLQHPASRQWFQVPAEEALLTEPQTMVDPSELLDYLQVPSAIRDKGIESIGGLRTRRLSFDIDRDRMQALAERRPPARAHLVSLQEPRAEIWIGEADGYTYRMTVEMIVEVAYEGGDHAQARIETFVDIWLSDFGRSFDIQAPLAG